MNEIESNKEKMDFSSTEETSFIKLLEEEQKNNKNLEDAKVEVFVKLSNQFNKDLKKLKSQGDISTIEKKLDNIEIYDTDQVIEEKFKDLEEDIKIFELMIEEEKKIEQRGKGAIERGKTKSSLVEDSPLSTMEEKGQASEIVSKASKDIEKTSRKAKEKLPSVHKKSDFLLKSEELISLDDVYIEASLKDMPLKDLVNFVKLKTRTRLNDKEIENEIMAANPDKLREDREILGKVSELTDLLRESDEFIKSEKNKIFEKISQRTGLLGYEVGEIFDHQLQIIEKEARNKVANSESIKKKLAKTAGKMTAYMGAGLGVGIATGGVGVFAGLGVASVGALRVLESYRTGQVSSKKLEASITVVKSELNKDQNKDLFINNIIAEIATYKQNQIDNKKETISVAEEDLDNLKDYYLDEKNFDSKAALDLKYTELENINRDQLEIYLKNLNVGRKEREDILRNTSILNKINFENQLVAEKFRNRKRSFVDKVASKLGKAWDSTLGSKYLKGGESAREKATTSAIFVGMGAVARSMPGVRNVLMGYGGMKLGDLAGGLIKGEKQVHAQDLINFKNKKNPKEFGDLVMMAKTQLLDDKFKKENPTEYAFLNLEINKIDEENVKKVENVKNFISSHSKRLEHNLNDKYTQERLNKLAKIDLQILGGLAAGFLGDDLVREAGEFIKHWNGDEVQVTTQEMSVELNQEQQRVFNEAWKWMQKHDHDDVFSKEELEQFVKDHDYMINNREDKLFDALENKIDQNKIAQEINKNPKILDKGFDKIQAEDSSLEDFNKTEGEKKQLEKTIHESNRVKIINPDDKESPLEVESTKEALTKEGSAKSDAEKFAPDPFAPIPGLEEAKIASQVAEDAIIKKGEGIEHALIRQLKANPQEFGYKEDLTKSGEIAKWAGGEAHKLAINSSYVNAETGAEVRVGTEGVDRVAYVLKTNSEGELEIEEHFKNEDGEFELRESHKEGDPFEEKKDREEYEYGYKKAQVEDVEDIKSENLNNEELEKFGIDVKDEVDKALAGYLNQHPDLLQDDVIASSLSAQEIQDKADFGNISSATVNEVPVFKAEDVNSKNPETVEKIKDLCRDTGSGPSQIAKEILNLSKDTGASPKELLDSFKQLSIFPEEKRLYVFNLLNSNNTREALGKIFNTTISQDKFSYEDGLYKIKDFKDGYDLFLSKDLNQIKFSLDGPGSNNLGNDAVFGTSPNLDLNPNNIEKANTWLNENLSNSESNLESGAEATIDNSNGTDNSEVESVENVDDSSVNDVTEAPSTEETVSEAPVIDQKKFESFLLKGESYKNWGEFEVYLKTQDYYDELSGRDKVVLKSDFDNLNSNRDIQSAKDSINEIIEKVQYQKDFSDIFERYDSSENKVEALLEFIRENKLPNHFFADYAYEELAKVFGGENNLGEIDREGIKLALDAIDEYETSIDPKEIELVETSKNFLNELVRKI
ncbi:hypothetical protein K8R62_02775 [bacterium]|nr:hypothetical protein [bacterium]